MGEMVIVAYRPKPGHETDLHELVKDHVPVLRRLGMVTNRPALAMQGSSGVVIEVFEWQEGAISKAHDNAEVQELWAKYAAVCDYVPLRDLPEARNLFAEFTPIDI